MAKMWIATCTHSQRLVERIRPNEIDDVLSAEILDNDEDPL
jgi:hypothetical protein